MSEIRINKREEEKKNRECDIYSQIQKMRKILTKDFDTCNGM